MRLTRLTAACVFATVIFTELAQAQRSNPYTERYGILSDRNVFLKDRAHPSTRPATQASSPRDPERSVWLAGVVLEEDGFRAYVENQNIGTVTRLAVGDAIARGKISAIDINAVAYESSGHTTWIEIGNDFANRPIGSLGESVSMSAASAAPTTTPSGLEGVNPNDPNLTVEQRLKLRRLQELKGK